VNNDADEGSTTPGGRRRGMNKLRRVTLRRAGGLTSLAGVVTVGIAVLASQAVAAGGNPNFEGILSAASPTGSSASMTWSRWRTKSPIPASARSLSKRDAS